MNRFFKNMMTGLTGLTIAAVLLATPLTADATRVLGSQSNGSTATQTTTTTETNTQETAAAAELIGNGTVTADSVRVRKDASTNSDVVGKATQGTSVGVTGEKNDSSNMLWYAVTFTSDGKTINGYIRSDLMSYEAIEVVPEETAPVEETPAEDTSAPEEQAPAVDFYVQYADDGTGVSDWYLIDQNMGKQYKISELLSAQTAGSADVEEAEGQVGKFRIIIIALAVVVLILIGVVTFLIIRLRNAGDEYEYDDEDEEEEEEDEEEDEEPVRRRGFFGRRRDYEDDEDEEEEEEEEPVRRAPARRPLNTRPARQYEIEEEEDEEEEYQPRRTQKQVKNQKDKNFQSKNFLEDDDLEFEFLDLK